ncbi:DUF6792 domain-containing protein [Companilactobacillus sp. DQM5]|uniref:DUF6792 domain-containing protein n=1 Tax=Companilactobacillus sp. DQM5 TaxID=3463359 RepID=UPI004058A077
MDTNLITNLSMLEQVFLDLDKLNFKAHTYIPLTLDQNKTQELLVKNKRLLLRLNYLKIKKRKIINSIIFSLQNDYLIFKVKRLKYLDKQTDIINSKKITRHRKINNLKDVLNKIQNEKISESLILIRQCLAFLFESNNLHNYQIEYKDDLFNSKDFKINLMELNYLSTLFSVSELNSYVKFLIFKYSGKIAKNLEFFDAREVLIGSEEVGFSAFAYKFNINDNSYCYISYKGTEGSLENSKIKSFTKRFDNYINEGYRDWAYNIDAILLGDTSHDYQLNFARNFTKKIIKELNPNTIIYGLGHSLGGHFVQTIQLLDNLFDQGYTLNSAPIQLRQIKHYKPDLFDESTWEKLFSLTYYNTQDIETDLLIRTYLKKDFSEITNEWFRNDLTRIYFGFPHTFYMGSSNYLNTTNWYYPFKSNIVSYLKEDDIQLYIDFFGGLIEHLRKSKNVRGTQIMFSILTYSFQIVKELYGVIKTDKAKNIFKDFSTYLYESKIFKDSPAVVQANFKKELSKPMTAIRVLKGEWPFLSSINNDMIDTVVYFHTIDGAKHFK